MATRLSADRQSAGILLYRFRPEAPCPDAGGAHTKALIPHPSLEVFLVHPGGPFWRNKDAGSWTIPKGEFGDAEPTLDAAIREFREETGATLSGHFRSLTPIRQKGGKLVFAWVISGDLDPTQLISNTFEIEWPRGSGKLRTFPEVDKGGWFTLPAAREHINTAQIAFLEELAALTKNDP